jgi:hypothetical protein
MGHAPVLLTSHTAVLVVDSEYQKAVDSWRGFSRGVCWNAKVAGAWALDQATDGAALDWWMNFSSGATLIGFPGLGAYAAACSWLDGFTLHQRARGIPAVSVAWGAWSDHGLGQSFADRGYKMISVEKGTGIRIPAKSLWTAGSPAELASHVLHGLDLPAAPATAQAVAPPRHSPQD